MICFKGNYDDFCLAEMGWGPSLAQYAFQHLMGGDSVPFDRDLTSDAMSEPAEDWAVRAERGLFYELNDRGAVFSRSALSRKIKRTMRQEIVEVMAAIIRQAETNR